MALQMATNILPDALNGVGGAAFDATKGLTVSWQVNGASAMTDYKITINSNDTQSTELYTTGKVTLAEPFYGTDYAGNIQRFTAGAISAATLASNNITNGNEYKMTIQQWWGATDDESITQSSASLIEAWSAGTVSITNLPSPLTQRYWMFEATYTQAEGVGVSWVRWRVALSGQEDSPVYDTGNIYGTAELKGEYGSFWSGQLYSVRCDVEGQNGVESTTGWLKFNVVYNLPAPDGTIEAGCVNGKSGIVVSWPTAKSANGTVEGSYSYSPEGYLVLDEGAVATWDEMNKAPIDFATPWTIIWKGKPLGRHGSPIWRLDTDAGYITMSVEQTQTDYCSVVLDVNGTVQSKLFNGFKTLLNRTWAVAVTPTYIRIQYIDEAGGLYPLTTLYPDTTLYPQASTNYTFLTDNKSVTYTQSPINAIHLYGAQTAQWLWIIQGEVSASKFTNLIYATVDYVPKWEDDDTLFLATFNGSLNAGNLHTTMYSLYRRDITTGRLEKVADFDVDILSVIDYGAKNQHVYSYQLWYTDDASFQMQPFVSDNVAYCSWDYSLLVCDEDENGVYHVKTEYKYGLNVSTNEVSNNNSPSLQKNFTRYPNWQGVGQLYKSGQLKALIGSINGTTQLYEDTQELADEMQLLSIEESPMFLKDRKGSVIKIRPNGPITMGVEDNYPNQQITMSFPWVEVGTTDEVGIVATDNDSAYGA